MTFPEAIRSCLTKYATFSGRASRSEYWWFFLFLMLGNLVASVLDGVMFGARMMQQGSDEISIETNGPLASIFGLGILLPTLAAGWRRMHDSGRSGLHLLYPMIATIGLFSFAAIVGGIDQVANFEPSAALTGGLGIVMILAAIVVTISPLIVLWWLTRPSQPGTNRYGPNPHEVTQ